MSNNKLLDATDLVKAFDILRNTVGSKYPNELRSKSIPDYLYGVVLINCKAGVPRKKIVSFIKNYEIYYAGWFTDPIINELGKAKYIFLLCVKHHWIVLARILSKIKFIVN